MIDKITTYNKTRKYASFYYLRKVNHKFIKPFFTVVDSDGEGIYEAAFEDKLGEFIYSQIFCMRKK